MKNRNNRHPNIPKNHSAPAATPVAPAPTVDPQDLGIKARPYVADTAGEAAKSKTLPKAPSWIARKLPNPGFVPQSEPIAQPSEEELARLRAEVESDLGDDADEDEELLALAREGGDAGIDIPTAASTSMRRTLHAPDPETQARANAPTLPETPKRHPLLSRLLSSFGLERLPIRYNNIGGFQFGFRKHNTEDMLLATRMAGSRMRGTAEFDLAYSIVLAAICLVDIDGESVYDIFNVGLTEAERQSITRNPQNPPQAIVENTSPHVIVFMTTHIEPEVLNDIARAYSELYHEDVGDHVGDIVTYQRTHWRFECQVPGCEEVQKRIPKIIDAVDGTYEPIFCPIHGEPMQAISTLEKYRNNPLA